MTSVMMDEDSDGDGIDDGMEYKELTIEKNPDFDIDSMEMTQEMSFDLSEKVEVSWPLWKVKITINF